MAKDGAAASLEKRLKFYRINPNDENFSAIAKTLDQFAETALAKFYENVASTPETATYFASKAAVERASRAQAKHWRDLFTKGINETYYAATQRVGDIHARIGLDPQWYNGGYANILEHMITAILTDGLGRLSPRRQREARMISTLVKVALLDMDLSVSRIFEVDKEKRVAVLDQIGRVLGGMSAGDLTGIISPLPPEYSKIEGDFRSAFESLSDTFRQILDGSSQIASTASEIRAASDDLARRTEQQAASLEESAAAMDELTGAISATTNVMKDLNTSVSRTHSAAQGGGEVVQQAISAMDEIEKSSGEIAKIIGIIDDIAFQTNLLALNAGVEAARVGEHGRGFAVVANEVRSLAQSSAEAAEQIKALIKTSETQVSKGVRMVNDVGKALAAIMTQVGETSGVAAKITESSATQSVNLRHINSAITEMAETTQRNAAMVEESNAAAHSMEEEAERVADAVGQFRVRDKRQIWNAA